MFTTICVSSLNVNFKVFLAMKMTIINNREIFLYVYVIEKFPEMSVVHNYFGHFLPTTFKYKSFFY